MGRKMHPAAIVPNCALCHFRRLPGSIAPAGFKWLRSAHFLPSVAARSLAESPDQNLVYLDEANLQLRSLGEITSRSLAFIRLETEAKEIDLVELATSALRLHEHQI